MTSDLICDLGKLLNISDPQLPYLQRNTKTPKSCLSISKGYHEAQMRKYRICFQANCEMKEGGVYRKEFTYNELLKSELVKFQCSVLSTTLYRSTRAGTARQPGNY